MPTPRRIILNALYLAPGESGGPETYLRGLAPALADAHPEIDLLVATTISGHAALAADGWEDFCRLQALPCEDGQRLRRQWTEQVLLPRLVRSSRADLVHSLASLAPLHPGTRAVVTLHDVTFLVRPTFGRVTTLGMGFLVRQAARRADALITATEAAREEISAVLGVPAERFAIVPHGHEATGASEPTPAAELRARFELGEARVVLNVAAKRPHKNQEVLIRALAQLSSDTLLVLAGHAEAYELELRALADRLAVAERVRFVGYVTDGDLEGLWRLASCAAFPTLGEGFGIPLIEAFAHGLPVACSAIPVLEEVGGSLPHYFDPLDPAGAATAITAAMADRRAGARGPERAASFTWRAAAEGTFAAYERALS